MSETIEVPVHLLTVHHTKGFVKRVEETAKKAGSLKAAYYQLEEDLEKHFGYRKYASLESFSRVRSHIKKKSK